LDHTSGQNTHAIVAQQFILLAPCPPGWKIPSELSVKLARLAVQTKVFPLYEIEHGREYTLNATPDGVPVREYLQLQGRVSHLKQEEIESIQQRVDEQWEDLRARCREPGTLLATRNARPRG
jgi:pyruvate/2-oxoacid:ferredoxin oxidoreductase beta subunit